MNQLKHFKRLAVLSLLMLMTALSSIADNDYYKRGGPEVTNLGNGKFTIRYLSYDYSGMDDFLKEMKVYLDDGSTSNEAEHVLLFRHRGAHENNYDDREHFNGGRGYIYIEKISECKPTYTTETFGDEVYRTVTFTLPERYWGYVSFRFEGKFYYSKVEVDGTEFKTYSRNNYIGDARFKNSPYIQTAYLKDYNNLYVNIGSVPYVKGTDIQINYEINGKVLYTYAQSAADRESGSTIPLFLYHSFPTSDIDFTKENELKVTSTVIYHNNKNVTTITKKIQPWKYADNVAGEYNPMTRSVTLNWDIKGSTFEKDNLKLLVYRQPEGGAWELIDKIQNVGQQTEYIDYAAKSGFNAETDYVYRLLYLKNDAAEPDLTKADNVLDWNLLNSRGVF